MSPMAKSVALLCAGILVPAVLEVLWLEGAQESLEAASDETAEVAVASAADDEYCTPRLKGVLRRVASACGLVEGGSRGCQPQDAKTVASISGDDFNALFTPLKHRVHIVQFDAEQVELDDGGKQLVEQAWADQRGASYFFVVSRASRDGDAAYNQQLSQQRAEAVLSHLEAKFQDPDLKNEVGLMWLGEEFAQLSTEFCDWTRSRDGECNTSDINRSAFVAWIDCAI